MSNHLCRKCNSWITLDTDEHCSWCGCRLSFHAQVEPGVVYESSTQRAMAELNLTNYRSLPLVLESIECSVEGLLVDKEKHQDTRIDGSQRIPLQLNLDGIDLAKERWVELVITAIPSDPEAQGDASSYKEKAAFCLSPEPVLKMPDWPLKITVDDGESPFELCDIPLTIERGAMHIVQVGTAENVPWIKLEPKVKAALLAASLDEPARRQIQIPFRILRKELREEIGNDYPSELSFSLTVNDGMLQAHRLAGKVTILLQYPPKLRVKSARQGRSNHVEIWTLERTELLWDKRDSRVTELRIELENIGDARLLVENIHLAQPYPWANLSATALELGPRNTNEPPSTASLYVSVDANHARRARPESLEIEMTLRGGEGTPPVARITVPIEYAELEEFDGIVAIDFGTSYTTCAYYSNGEPHQLFLDGEASVPTAVFYEDTEAGKEPIYCIGEMALAKGRTSPGSLVTEVKRRLGSSKGIEVRFNKKPGETRTYRPEEIASHFLLEYRKRIEATLKKAIEECVITHPVFFLDSSVTALGHAFSTAGFKPLGFDDSGEATNILVEPVAAAFKFISEDIEGHRKARTYSLGVFDFGGGTTDYTLINVSYSDDGETPLVRATIEEVDGERFGGHDVTMRWAYTVLELWKKEYESKHGPVSIPLEIDDIKKELDPVRKSNFLINRKYVLDEAERTKKEISDKSEAFVSLNLKLPSPEQIVFRVTQQDLAKVIEPDIEGLVNSFKEMIVAGLTPGADQNGDGTGEEASAGPKRKLDIIVVSGNSSRLPPVWPLLRKTFPETRIEPLQDEEGKFSDEAKLKESIVCGLLEYHKINRVPVPAFVLDDNSSLQMPNKLIVSVGVLNDTSSLGEYFHEIINKRKALPTAWVRVGGSLRKEKEIFLLAMGGRSTRAPLRITENGSKRWNSRIQQLGKIRCSDLPTPRGGWKQCTAEIQVEQNRSVRFQISQDGKPIHEQALPPEVILD